MDVRAGVSARTTAVDDAPCVSFYRTIRDGVSPASLQIGFGYNLYPPSPTLVRHIAQLFVGLGESDRLSQYSSPVDDAERSLLAALLNRHLGRADLEGADVAFTNGSTEAINVACAYAAAIGCECLLPLPSYYAFEQSSRRRGVPVAGYYGPDGVPHWGGEPPARLFRVLVVPNGVSGTIFSSPDTGGLDAELTLVDCVFQLGAHREQDSVPALARELFEQFDLERTAFIFTPSKDLSVPGLRAGILVSKNRDLVAFAKADRFERTFSASPLVAQVALLYCLLLLLVEADSRGGSSPYGEIVDLLTAFELGALAPPEEEAAEIVAHVRAMASRFRSNLALATEGGYPLSVSDGWRPYAGYSAFPRVTVDFRDAAEFVSWVHRAGTEHRLKLNPSYLFGGTREAWDAVYPDEYRLRLNVSVEPDYLVSTLDRLAAALA